MTMANVAANVASPPLRKAASSSVKAENTIPNGRTSSDRLRSDLFHKLGLPTCASGTTHISQRTSARPLLANAQVYNEPLKYDAGEQEQEKPRPRSYSWHSLFPSPTTVVEDRTKDDPKRRNRKLSFGSQVEVVPIPTRHEYSNRVKERLWITASEMEIGAYRNALEFTAEGWDWRTATEDEGMYRCTQTGEKIHPVHIEPQMIL